MRDRGGDTTQMDAGHRQRGGVTTTRSEQRTDAARPGFVVRQKLLDRLRAATDERVVAVVAPAGYGKTTLLSQWLQQDSRPGAYLAVERSDNDPARLLHDLRSTLQQAGMLAGDAPAERRFTSAIAATAGVRGLIGDLDGQEHGILVVDQAETLNARAARDVVVELAAQLPDTITFAVATHSDTDLASGRLRARGALLELLPPDLAMTTEEAALMASQMGITPDPDLIEALLERTEGWPVGIYLMLLAMQATDRPLTPDQIRGDDRYLADYLQSEVFAKLSRARASFALHSSILTELSGPLCDHVLERTGSSRLLDSMERSNLLITPLDRQRRWYRYHHLLREFLVAELRRREPESEARLHRRAAAWFEEHGPPEKAIEHAVAAGDEDRVARYLVDSARTVFAEGRVDTVLEWMSWFEESGRMERHPEVAILAALTYAHLGDAPAAQRWAATFEAVDDLGPVAPLAVLARALMVPESLEQMHDDALAAQEMLTARSGWYAAAVAVEGLALLYDGEIEVADGRFAMTAETAERYSALPTATFCLAARSAIAAARGERDVASALADRAVDLVDRGGLTGYSTSVLPFVVAARSATRAGDPAAARRWLGRAAAARPTLSAALPALSIHSLLEVAEAEIEIGDIPGARQVLREAADILNQRPGLGSMEQRYAGLKERLADMPTGRIGVASLTNAELRLLPYLATHLSFPEIGERLYISRHTVKTQAVSIYRKLGASSRSEAVELAQDAHLLER